jgi:hypothetical protein
LKAWVEYLGTFAAEGELMDIIATIPLHKLEISRQEDEAVKGLADEACNWYWALKPKPKNLAVGDRIYFVENGHITAWCPVMELGDFNFVCQVSGRHWFGYQARLGQNRLFVHPVAHRGFQGWRYVPPELQKLLSAGRITFEHDLAQLLPKERTQLQTRIAKLAVTLVPAKNQISGLEETLRLAGKVGERVIVSAAGKRASEDLSEYLSELGFNTRYFHSDVGRRYRENISEEFRVGGVTVIAADMLDDLPRPSVMVILDAGEIRSPEMLMRTAARATARVIVCSDVHTPTIHKVFRGSS